MTENSVPHTEQVASGPPPAWLLRLAFASGGLAVIALCAALWAKWGVVVAMSTDILKACF